VRQERGIDMSKRARDYREAYEAKHYPERWEATDWRKERDEADKPPPEPEEPEPIHTFH
jgi:hypothetical protein